jgi:hypothetical protein
MELKKFSSTVIWAAALICALTVGCGSDGQPEIAQGIDGCSSCGMVIDKVNQAAGYYVGKDFKPFCSPGCLLRSFENKRKQGGTVPERIYFADYLGSGLHSSDSAVFLITKHVPSVMGWGIVGFTDRDAANEHRKHEDESVLDWTGLRTQKGEPDRTISLVFAPDGISPEVVELNKGELVEWEIKGNGLDRDVSVQLRGYEEIGEIVVPASGEIIKVRLLATKPGSGFPFVLSGSEKVLGQVRIVGAHTAEEEDV